jgi:hypothetical protein
VLSILCMHEVTTVTLTSLDGINTVFRNLVCDRTNNVYFDQKTAIILMSHVSLSFNGWPTK